MRKASTRTIVMPSTVASLPKRGKPSPAITALVKLLAAQAVADLTQEQGAAGDARSSGGRP
jgi:hypothetical protein